MENIICCTTVKKNFYQKICEYVDENLYFFYAILAIMLVGCCFNPIVVWIFAAYLLILSCFLPVGKILGLAAFVCMFTLAFRNINSQGLSLEFLPIGILCSVGGAKTILDLIIKRIKPNFWLIGALALFLIYIILPFHSVDRNVLSRYFIAAGLVFIAFENRKNVSFSKIVIYLCVGVLFSSMLAIFKPISPRLQELIVSLKISGFERFEGLRSHPNYFAYMCELALVGLFLVKLKNKIKSTDFFALFCGLTVFGFLTFSRNFIFSSVISISLFLLGYLIVYKKKALGLVFAMIIFILACIFVPFKQTKVVLARIANSFTDMEYTYNVIHKDDPRYSDEWWQSVLNGETRYDPGRREIAKNYIDNWASSPKTILFGRGIGAPKIGQLHAHNMWIYELWMHGVLGYVIYAFIVFAMINFKKLKQIKLKHVLPILIFVLPMLFISVFEALTLNYAFYVLAILFFSKIIDENESATHHA